MRRRDTGAQRQRRHAVIVGAVAAFALLAALPGDAVGDKAGASTGAKVTVSPLSATHRASPDASQSPSETPTPTATPTLKPTPAKPSAIPVAPANAGTLPQTNTLPKTTSTAFSNAVHDIWLAVTTGNPDYARPAFFPEKAYEQVKAIADPESDWQGRLWYDFTLDLAAVHKLVGKNATTHQGHRPERSTRSGFPQAPATTKSVTGTSPGRESCTGKTESRARSG